MSLWKRIFGQSSNNRNPSDDFWYKPIGAGSSVAGPPVTYETALQVPVVFNCLDVLASTIGSLPWAIFERSPDGSREQADNHPVADMLRNPNEDTTDVEFFTQLMWDLAPAGNFFAEAEMTDGGQITQIRRHDPTNTTVKRLDDGSVVYEFRENEGQPVRVVPGDRVWHVKDFPHLKNGLIGSSRIVTGKEAIGAALAVQDYAARFFANDATPPFVLQHPAHFADQDMKKKYMASISRLWGGKNRHRPALLEYGIELNRVGINNDEAQFLETKKEAAVECARIWNIPPHKVGILEKATLSNIEHQSLDFVTDTLLPWLRLLERSIAHNFIIDNRFFFEFNVAGLLRGDLKTRYEAYSKGRQWGWLSANDIRQRENMNPIEGGDTYLEPLNMVPAGTDPRVPESQSKIYGPNGQTVSIVDGGNVIRMEDYLKHAA